jgi:hypothetical protein
MIYEDVEDSMAMLVCKCCLSLYVSLSPFEQIERDRSIRLIGRSAENQLHGSCHGGVSQSVSSEGIP